MHRWKPGPPALHDRLASDSRQPLMVFGRLGLIPPDNRPVSGKRTDVVDSQLDQFLHHELRSAALDQGEGNAESRFGWRDTHCLAGGLDGITPTARAPAPSAIPDRQRVTRSKPEYSIEVMAIVGTDLWAVNGRDEDMGPMASVRRLPRHENADLMRPKMP